MPPVSVAHHDSTFQLLPRGGTVYFPTLWIWAVQSLALTNPLWQKLLIYCVTLETKAIQPLLAFRWNMAQRIYVKNLIHSFQGWNIPWKVRIIHPRHPTSLVPNSPINHSFSLKLLFCCYLNKSIEMNGLF